MPKVSIVIPIYNQSETVGFSINSALRQDYLDKEIFVVDDNSPDKIAAFEIIKDFPVEYHFNEKNIGLGGNLNECVKHAQGEYIIILCGDDTFTHKSVVSDMVKIFDENPNVGIVGRYYYQYLDGYDGAVMTIRGDIFTSSCQPSGIGFRKSAIKDFAFTNDLFIEVPLMVRKVLDYGYSYKMLEYDTIAARLHYGKNNNAASRPSYYKVQQSSTLNWYKVLREPIGMYMGFIQIKNNAPWMLWSEMVIAIKLNPKCLLNPGFWFCVLIALIVPGWILRPLSRFYRHRITRYFVKIIERPL